MRTKVPTKPDLLDDGLLEDALLENDVLEPLPVVVDGVTRDPVPVELDAVAALVPDSSAINERCELVGTRIVEAPGWRVLTPWVYPPPVVPFVRLTAPDTFSRMIAIDPSYLMALPAWWRRRVRGDRYEPVRNFSLFEPRGASGVWTARVSLRWRLHRRSLPMELTLWPHFEGWSRLQCATVAADAPVGRVLPSRASRARRRCAPSYAMSSRPSRSLSARALRHITTLIARTHTHHAMNATSPSMFTGLESVTVPNAADQERERRNQRRRSWSIEVPRRLRYSTAHDAKRNSAMRESRGRHGDERERCTAAESFPHSRRAWPRRQ